MKEQADQLSTDTEYDVFVVGGGINGCGIARDAAGRGYSVCLAEMNDFGSGTSSGSTKLIHGGLRYLEHYEFRLVREALMEREVLWGMAPHIIWPLRFILPHHKGLRPAWFLRLGLYFYDYLGGRKLLPPTKTLDMRRDTAGKPLKPLFEKAFEYSDCWVQDSRLVVLNARDAAARGAKVMTRTKVVATQRHQDHWEVTTQDRETGETATFRARLLVNAAGPWVGDVIRTKMGLNTRVGVRLVRGSHIVVKKLYDHDKCYFFQGTDGRIIFSIPYEEDFTLIGTTDKEHADPEERAVCSPEEQHYLCDFASQYFKTPVTRDDIVWTYSGVRPLYDDGASSATAATRDYTLKLDKSGGAPVLSCFGGKITTYRKLAEEALAKLHAVLPESQGAWTAGAALPGGDFPVAGFDALCERIGNTAPWMDARTLRRLARAYGTKAFQAIGDATCLDELGEHFGAGLTESEVRYLIDQEWARTADDVLWRRSKLGLRLRKDQRERLAAWMAESAVRGGRHAAE